MLKYGLLPTSKSIPMFDQQFTLHIVFHYGQETIMTIQIGKVVVVSTMTGIGWSSLPLPQISKVSDKI